MTENQEIIPEEMTNQTLFGNQEPLLQSDRKNVTEVDDNSTVGSQPKKKSSNFLILGGVVAILLLGSLFLLAIMTPKRQTVTVIVSPTPSPSAYPLPNQFQARVDELNQDLQNADPSQVNLTTPPVDLTLSLDPASH